MYLAKFRKMTQKIYLAVKLFLAWKMNYCRFARFNSSKEQLRQINFVIRLNVA